MIFTIRTTSGREDIVVDLLMTKINSEGLDIKSVFHPAEIKGYIFVEGKIASVHKAMQGLMHIRGLISKPINFSEISHFLEYKKARLQVDDGDIIEIIGGPFKAEKGRIIRINKIKDEVTVELLEATIPIPVTIATEFVKMVKKSKPEAMESKESVFDKVEPLEKGEVLEERKPESEEPKEAEEFKDAETEEPEKEKRPRSFLDELEPKKKKKSFLEELEEADKR